MGHDFSISKLNNSKPKKQVKELQKKLLDYKLQIKNEKFSGAFDSFMVDMMIFDTGSGELKPFEKKNIEIAQKTACCFPSQVDKTVYSMFNASKFDGGVSGINDGKVISKDQVIKGFVQFAKDRGLLETMEGNANIEGYEELLDFFLNVVAPSNDDEQFFIHYS